ncbi:parallel beta helix pectate lyase-like protein [Roseimicrobium gellanilyticum]|uniref:Parallel beta helix pectate lyase-like protein n=1 Tax=Roseimicrobium gellanilyticum TaxID=748857 RepID=A0A366HLP8_9BACT|nr:right-handed parallel beta-helix repeat-containing protein [Roseimicrobium gellanilyticum]RBP42683.1 parallel beta helix pectate lyase-like protein [Roseimicrobium gellanilyticum]
MKTQFALRFQPALPVTAACWLMMALTLQADVYVSPAGAGNKDGNSREHAAAAQAGGLQRAWDALPAEATLWLLPGEYKDASLDIAPRADGKARVLAGLAEGGKRAVFIGDFDKTRPGKTGGHVITVMQEASDWVLKDLDFRDVNTAVHLLGGNTNGKLEGLRVYGSREGIRSEGKGKAATDSKDITVSDCVFEHFTKRGLRLLAGHKNITMERCSADAGGKEWATEPFQMGFAVENDCDGINFTDCVARGSYNDAGKKYWNGDGFCVEQAGTVTWTRCRAFDNTDGGWDTKANLSVFVDCIALRNKRNIRVWGKATLENCLAAYAQYPKGTDGACVWSKGEVELKRCTLVGSRPVECEDGGKVTLEKSYIVPVPRTDGERGYIPLEWTRVDDSEFVMSDADGVKKLFVAPEKEFEGGTGFNRREGGSEVGYKHREK